MKKEFSKKKPIALSEIILLIIGIVAFSYIVGLNNVPLVSAVDEGMGLAEGITGGIKDLLTSANFMAIAIIAYTFFSVGIQTGEWSRATEAALRAGLGAGVGYVSYSGLVALGAIGPAGWIAVGAMILGASLSKIFQREQDRKVEFMCKPWQPKSGGDDCTLCNNQIFPCTEYQCRSLGTGCELINKDTSDPKCVHKNPRDVNSPEITPWTEILLEGYKYNPLPRGQYGVEIEYQNQECLPAFTPFIFGVELDKLGYCKINLERTSSFEEMNYDFGGRNSFLTQHSHILSFPGVANIQDYLEQLGLEEEAVTEVMNDGEYELYVRCMAASNGRANTEEFLFKFCIDKGPDTGAPEIRGFNWANNAPISYFDENESREVDIRVYTNEPAQCRWDHEEKDYKDMKNSLSCSSNLITYNAQISYTCSGKLTGIENKEENKFYFKCNDTSGNINSQSRTLSLIGTQPLVIDSVSPEDSEIIKGSSDVVKVTLESTTSAGYREGQAECSYNTQESGTYVKFTNTGSHTHSTNIWLEPGDYSYYIRCYDLAGNADSATTSFSVETDTSAPLVVRAFNQENQLKIITNEPASCVYDTVDCSYELENGVPMSTSDDIVHTVSWDPEKSFYVKCQDDFGNRPLPNQCSMIVRPFSG